MDPNKIQNPSIGVN